LTTCKTIKQLLKEGFSTKQLQPRQILILSLFVIAMWPEVVNQTTRVEMVKEGPEGSRNEGPS